MSWNHLHINQRRWQVVRRDVLDVSNWRCTKCGKYGNEVDHIRPLHKGGEPWGRDNLQALCRGCHIQKTRSENRRPPTLAELKWKKLVSELAF